MTMLPSWTATWAMESWTTKRSRLLEEDSMDGGMDQDELSQLELAEDYAPPLTTDSAPTGAGLPFPTLAVLVLASLQIARDPLACCRPTSSCPTPSQTWVTARRASSTQSDRFRLDDGPRRTASASDEVATHPLLVDQSDADAIRHAGRATRHGAGSGRFPSGYTDWAQSVEDFVGEGALQFLEHLLTRGGAAGRQSQIRIELANGGRMRIDGIDMSRTGRGGHHHHHHHLHHHHSHTHHGQAVLGGDAQRAASDRQAAAQNDPVTLAQSFTPMPTLTRWRRKP